MFWFERNLFEQRLLPPKYAFYKKYGPRTKEPRRFFPHQSGIDKCGSRKKNTHSNRNPVKDDPRKAPCPFPERVDTRIVDRT